MSAQISQLEVANVFEDSLKQVVLTTTGFYLNNSNFLNDELCEDVAVILNFNGEHNGFLLLDAAYTHVITLCSYMTGIEGEKITREDASDCFCELANMTGGTAKSRLAQKDFPFYLTLPFVIFGEDKQIYFKEHSPVLQYALNNGVLTVNMRVVLYG